LEGKSLIMKSSPSQFGISKSLLNVLGMCCLLSKLHTS